MKRTFLLIFTSLAVVLLLASCGSNSSMTKAGLQNVTIQTGDATNDQIIKFELTINSITLTGAAGTSNTQNLLSQPREVEFAHEAGHFEPLTLANVPPGTYSGATLMVSDPEVVAVVNGVPTKLAASLSSSTVNITFTSNIMIGSSPMFLNFDLDMTNSVTINGNTATVSPTFKVTATTMAPNEQDEDDENGEIEDVHGKVTAVNPNATPANFTIQTSQSTITFVTNSNTKFEDGLNSVSDLKVGEIVEVDGVTQPDASKLATKVELEENENGMEVEGIVSAVTGTPATQITIAHQVDSSGSSTPPLTVDVQITSNTQFLVRLDELNLNLSVPVVFDASHIAKGQRVEVDSSSTGSPLVADKVKLREQALIGVISNLNGNTFTLTVSSTSAFASLSGTTTVSVIILSGWEDDVPLTNGATVRVRGLVFFDGTKYTLVAAHADDNN